MLPARRRPASAFGRAGTDQVTFHVRQTTQHGQHEAAGAGAGIGPRLGQLLKTRAGIRNLFDDGEQVEGGARQAVDPRHHHHITAGELAEQLLQLPPVSSRARHLLPVDVPASGRAELVKLGVERLALGANTGIAKKAGRWLTFGHIFRKR